MSRSLARRRRRNLAGFQTHAPPIALTLAGVALIGGAAYYSFSPVTEDSSPGEAVVPAGPGGTLRGSAVRDRVLAWVQSKVGSTVKWAMKGNDVFDCSGLITAAIYAVTGKDLRGSHNAAALYSASIPVLYPQPGDLGFRANASGVYHVMMYLGGNQFISADGATSNLVKALAIALRFGNRVKLHPLADVGADFTGWRTNPWA